MSFGVTINVYLAPVIDLKPDRFRGLLVRAPVNHELLIFTNLLTYKCLETVVGLMERSHS